MQTAEKLTAQTLESIAPVYTNGSVAIYPIPSESLKVRDRSIAYATRFNNIDVARLREFDFGSLHYEVWEGHACLGGFRLSPIGNKQSEIEEVFTDFKFVPGSLELGRLWVKDQKQGNGRKSMTALARWLGQVDVTIYFKQSALLGEVSKSVGAVPEGVQKWNPKLNYFVELFRFDQGRL